MSGTLKGVVIWWNRDKAYGIADVCQQNRQILLHNTQIMDGRQRGDAVYLRGGDIIEFETHLVNPNIAKNIRVVILTPPCSPQPQEKTPPRIGGGAPLYDDSTDEER